MRTNVRTPVALHAVLQVPLRYVCRDAALFKICSTGWNHAASGIQELGNRHAVAGQGVGRNQDVVEISGVLFGRTNQLLGAVVSSAIFQLSGTSALWI